MTKLILNGSLILLLCFSFKTGDKTFAYDKKSIVERFTNASCGPCASINNSWYNAATGSMVQSGTISHIIYNVWWPGASDPMYLLNQTDNTTRTNYYGCNSVPWIEVNASTISTSLSAFNTAVTNGNNEYAPFNINITQDAVSENLIQVSVKIIRDPIDVTTFNNVKLRVAITEKRVNYTSPPGSNGESEFFSVCRKMLPDAGGSTFTIPASGDSVELTLQYIPSTQFLNSVNLDSLRIVAFIQEDNGQNVYQSASLDMQFIGCSVGLPSNPTPTNGASNVSINLAQLSWANGVGTAANELYFGTAPGSLSLVQSSSLATNWTIAGGPLEYAATYYWQVVEIGDTCNTSGPLWSFTTELSPATIFNETFGNLSCWSPSGPLGTTNWTSVSTVNAGGTIPELRFSWSPQFNGLSKLVSCTIPVENSHNYSVTLKHMMDWYANPAPDFGIGVSYDNGATYTSIWNFQPTGNVGPETITASFTTPAVSSPDAINLNLVLYCNGNSYNIDYWYVDDIILLDDEFTIVDDAAFLLATALSSTEIMMGFAPNGNNDNIVIAWNLTGIFTAPSGIPPGVGQPFAGGTLLYNGTASPVIHSGLVEQTIYYYKAFSYDNVNYSTGLEVNDTTLAALATFSLSVSILDGWNMVSIPGLHPTDQNVLTWWPGKDPAAAVFGFNGAYAVVTTAAPGEGYWMKHSGANLYDTGDEWPAINIVTHDPIPGNAGWNLIGGYENIATTSLITTNPPGLVDGPVFGFSGGYAVATTLEPGYAYWIKLSAAGDINIPAILLGKSDTEPVEYFKEEWGRIIITDNAGRSFILYAVTDDVNLPAGQAGLDYYEMPPAPPEGYFDIRFSSNRIAEDINTALQTIEMSSGVEYPIVVKAENMDIRVQDESGRMLNEIIESGQQITINSQLSKLVVTSEIVPDVYALEQNYPNPFNPSTVIEFSLPEDVSNVRLTIYNALGERVAELVNTTLEAGKYSYQWDATNAATGMYIYELRTNNFVSVKKMLMIK